MSDNWECKYCGIKGSEEDVTSSSSQHKMNCPRYISRIRIDTDMQDPLPPPKERIFKPLGDGSIDNFGNVSYLPPEVIRKKQGPYY